MSVVSHCPQESLKHFVGQSGGASPSGGLNSSQLCSQRGEKAGIYFKSHPKEHFHLMSFTFLPILFLKIHVPK
jgi:hypothetical protein